MKQCIILIGLATFFATEVAAEPFRLSSPDIVDGRPAKSMELSKSYGFGCDGANVPPRLIWSGVPEGTKSFVLTLYDKDAPTGIGFMHWVLINIPAQVNKIGGAEALPEGTLEARTDLGVSGFMGLCPPQGARHEYVLTLSALKVESLPLDANSTPALVGFMTNANVLAKAELAFSYGR